MKKTIELHNPNMHGKDHHKWDKNIIEIDKVTFSYTSLKKHKHLDNVSINIKEGQWTTIIGPNGSGKSTLAKAIVKIYKPQHGEIKLDGIVSSDYKHKVFARKIAYIPQTIEVPSGTKVYDFIAFGRNPHLNMFGTLGKKDKDIIKEAMEKTGVTKWADLFVDELSGGQRQKVLVAMVYAQQADIVLLDEPTTYLDIRNQYELLELMDQLHHEGKTIITILHDINQAVQYSDEIYVMKNGKVYDHGTPDEVITEKNLEEIYGIASKLHKHGKKSYVTDIKLVDKK